MASIIVLMFGLLVGSLVTFIACKMSEVNNGS